MIEEVEVGKPMITLFYTASTILDVTGDLGKNTTKYITTELSL